MTTIELEVWKKIVDDPRAEVLALFKRRELTFADIRDDPLSWHMQAALWGILRCLDEAFSAYEYDQEEPGGSEYSHWAALANRTFSLGLLRAIREHADEMTAVLAARKSRDQMLRDQIAEQIRAELVCCDIYKRMNAQHKPGYPCHDGNYHETCYWGEAGAQIAEGNA